MKFGKKEFNDRRKEHLNSGKSIVWHGLSAIQFIEALESGTMKPYTVQRYWQDGKLRKDNHPEYESSYWMHGWSVSRNKNISMKFGAILLEIDLNEVKKSFNTRPISWNYTISALRSIDHKKEQEEFIVAQKGKICLQKQQELFLSYEEEIDDLYLKMKKLPKDKRVDITKQIDKIYEFVETNWFEKVMGGPQGKNMPIKNIVKGFYIDEGSNLNSIELEKLTKNSLFVGFFNRDEFNITNKKNPVLKTSIKI